MKLRVKSKKGKWRFSLKIIHLSLLAVFSISSLFGFAKYNNISLQELASFSFYENLANPSMRLINLKEGLRKEEVGLILENKLGWNEEEVEEFANAHLALGKENLEGYFFPKTYFIHKDSKPVDIAKMMVDTVEEKMKGIKKAKATQIINEDMILKIASMIQREAAGKKDMNLISGIIWNRIFKGMKLQIDATLQYAKGNEEKWWPQVDPTDKKIDSPYNTYIYKELPPSPIANPGLAAIEAAYNPSKTSCLFYLHDKKRRIHCAKTYEEHKRNIEIYY